MKYFLFITVILFSLVTKAQTSILEGMVTSKNTPVVANIFIKNTQTGTTSDFDGNYNLKISSAKQTLVISAVGFKTKEFEINLQEGETKNLNIELREDVLGLDQVVVTATRGHLNRKKAPVIVTVTDAKTLEATQSVSLSDGLNFQPGLRMENNCQNCGTSEVKMNGLGGAYSQILIDSRPIFSSLNSVYGIGSV